MYVMEEKQKSHRNYFWIYVGKCRKGLLSHDSHHLLLNPPVVNLRYVRNADWEAFSSVLSETPVVLWLIFVVPDFTFGGNNHLHFRPWALYEVDLCIGSSGESWDQGPSLLGHLISWPQCLVQEWEQDSSQAQSENPRGLLGEPSKQGGISISH